VILATECSLHLHDPHFCMIPAFRTIMVQLPICPVACPETSYALVS
jgi:hypothetical protein